MIGKRIAVNQMVLLSEKTRVPFNFFMHTLIRSRCFFVPDLLTCFYSICRIKWRSVIL